MSQFLQDKEDNNSKLVTVNCNYLFLILDYLFLILDYKCLFSLFNGLTPKTLHSYIVRNGEC